MVLTKQHLTKLGLTALSALILTACGSGGRGSSSNSTPTVPVQPTPAQTVPTQTTTTNQANSANQTTSQQTAKPSSPQQNQVQNQSQTSTASNSMVAVTPPAKESALPTQPSEPQHSTPTEQPVQPKTEAKPENGVSDSSTGAFSSVKDKVGTEELDIQIYPLNQFHLNKISIEGVEIAVDPNEYLPTREWASFSDQNTRRDVNICCEKFSDSHFGIVSSQDENTADYLFYNGNPTQAMPMSGTASYQGHAVFHDTDGINDTKLLVGQSTFNVDFGNKKLNGTLTANTIKPVNITADIKNNTFTGSATSEDFANKTRVEVQGKFFGENAKELGGIAESHDYNFGAAFGAKKQ